jgi:AcrR family transcriptional regulator
MHSPKRNSPLDPQAIVGAAVHIIRENGVRGLSMRALAAKLSVDPMAVYYHISNKAELEALIIEKIMETVVVPPPPASPEVRLADGMRSLRMALLGHGDVVELFLGRNLETPKQLEPVEDMLQALLEAGLPARESLWAVNALTDYVIGAVAGEVAALKARNEGADTETRSDGLSEARFPALCQVLAQVGLSRYADQFEFGLESLVRGMLKKLEEGETKP